jgi:hypothetical protein
LGPHPSNGAGVFFGCVRTIDLLDSTGARRPWRYRFRYVCCPGHEKGYAVIEREWKAGDRIELDLPMMPQPIVADRRVEATRGKVAFACGPIVYNVETADQPDIGRKIAGAPIGARWRPDLLGGRLGNAGRPSLHPHEPGRPAGEVRAGRPGGRLRARRHGHHHRRRPACAPLPAAPIRSQVWVDA